jgi:bacterioferritin
MQGKQQIIALLNKQLTLELSSMDQYLAHSKIYEDYGINKLHEKIAHEFEDELGHAKLLAERILFLEGKADTVSRAKVNIGDNVKQMLAYDLEAEHIVADNLRKTIALCEKEQDYVTRDMLLVLLDDTETDHIYWLERHLGLIEKIGLANYIQSQM